MKYRIFSLMLLLATLPLWFDPEVLQTCGKIVVFWRDPPTVATPYTGKVFVDGVGIPLVYNDDGTMTAPVPVGAKRIDWGYIVGSGPEWLGYIHGQAVMCNNVWIPFMSK
jgi:hypothetical protein